MLQKILFVVFLIACEITICQGFAADQRPNIVLIMADDFGYECLGCNGGLSYKTPTLDRMAKQGVRFTNCHSQPLCTPTRNQIMTGKYNFRNYENFEYLNPKEKTFGHLMQAAGYKTCIAGKWQLNGRGWKREGRLDSARPQKSGFDRSCLWQVTSLLGRFKNPGLEVDGKLREFPGEYGPDVCTGFICDFIREQKDSPFFVYYPMILTHSPFVPTPDSSDWNDKKKKRSRQEYFAEMVEYTDKIVARIEESLRANGVADNTILIFTGDNGTTRGLVTQTRTGKVSGGKGKTTDAGTHVPLVVRWPDQQRFDNGPARSASLNAKLVPPRQVSDDLIDFTDVLPTILNAAGTKIPQGFVCDGRSFLPQIKGETGNPRDHVYCFYDPVHSQNVNKFRNRFARSSRFKVYRDGKVFDMRKDLLEENPMDRQELSSNDQEEVNRLVKVLDDYDQQGAARAAEILKNRKKQ